MSEPSGANTTDADTAPRALFGPWFWAMLALAVLCIAAGGLIGFAGARLFPVPTHPAPSRASSPDTSSSRLGNPVARRYRPRVARSPTAPL